MREREKVAYELRNEWMDIEVFFAFFFVLILVRVNTKSQKYHVIKKCGWKSSALLRSRHWYILYSLADVCSVYSIETF